MGQGFRLGRIAGIEVQVDWSLLIIFALIASSLGLITFPSLHPNWSPVLSWMTALVAAVLFFGSVLVHELSHALVGRIYGMRVPRITLFIFGGMAHIESEPEQWRGELWMAIVGPITSLVLGFAFVILLNLLVGPEGFDSVDPRGTLANLSPLATLLLWLGPVNILLGLFNLVPGYPLDGGRVLRALMWGITGDMRRATRWASWAGQGFAWLLIGTGVVMLLGARVPFFGTGAINGLWLAFIGWFLNNAALSSYQQILLREALGGIRVGRLMRTRITVISPEMAVHELVEEYLLRGSERALPVVEGNRLVGLVGLSDVQQRDRSEWPELSVREVMIPRRRLVTVTPEEEALEALMTLSRTGVNQLPVVDADGRLVGIVQRADILNWMALYGDPSVAQQLRDQGKRE